MAATLDQKAGLANRNTFYKSINVLGYSLLLCLGVSILYTIFVQCIPNVMVRVAIFGGLLLCALLAVMVYLYPSSNTAVKIGIGIALSIVALIVLITITCNRSTLQLSVALMR